VRRQYDAFVEQNLRNAQADVKAQSPMSDYTNRIIDIMADESIGLTSSMNLFFESARNLATDPASLVARGSFLRDADGLAARFRQMSGQLDLIEKETRQALETGVDQVNAYIDQLAYVNRQLAKNATEAKQPAELLDQRDLLLRRMSELMNFNTKFEPNGAVLVSVGDTISRGILVDGVDGKALGVIDSPTEQDKLTFIVDPYGTPEPVAGVTSGQLGGLNNFREQVLTPSQNFMDSIAEIFVGEVNALHHNGLDLNGLVGGDMFQIDAAGGAAGVRMVLQDVTKIAVAGDFRVSDNPLNTSGAQARIAYTAPNFTVPPAIDSVVEAGLSDDYLTPFGLSTAVPAKPIGAVQPGQSDIAVYLDEAQSGQWLQVITRDGRHLVGSDEAQAETYLMGEVFGMEAGATYSPVADNADYLGMDIFLGARAAVTEVQQFDPSTGKVTTPGLASARLEADYPPASSFAGLGFNDNTFTLNGIAMPAPTDPATLDAWVVAQKASTGVTASYEGYTQADGSPGTRLVMRNLVAVVEDGLSYYGTAKSYALNALSINGRDMGELKAVATLQDVVDWVNESDLKIKDGISASIDANGKLVFSGSDETTRGFVETAVRNAAGIVSFDAGLTIDGHTMSDPTRDYTFQDVVNWVNDESANLGDVVATVNDLGQMVLEKELGNGTVVRSDTDIRLGLGSTGEPSDLTQLGFRTGLHVVGPATDDLVIAVTDFASAASNNSPRVLATYGDMTATPKTILREREMEVEFTALDRYVIRDLGTGDIMAERPYDNTSSASVISFRGLTVTLSSPPKVGDKFTVDGNQDGVGNNEAMLKIVNLEDNSTLMGNGLTLTETYIERVNDIGSLARQTNIAAQALEVVYQQAIETRDGVSGVNIDEEAADLVRYQQAYQANAKVMQVASTLFDAILAVR
jgi:flagellar hook-associated protein FlgK